ncbi:hypothetical protein SAMN05444000_11026 [Shimia gijangensis]|uniref:Uncharacterized protein n=1 Tax=Shimia gijangensis TaxID=1470563 RepID=A0A1M6K835_9RHOB|nr:hypothetical protein [Shimia gijangensis]SHJ55105.1 hypothetical protein SAMN05444000_11026 [Shimia gijangensis]
MRKEFYTPRIETAGQPGGSLLDKARQRRLRALLVCEESEENLFL